MQILSFQTTSKAVNIDIGLGYLGSIAPFDYSNGAQACTVFRPDRIMDRLVCRDYAAQSISADF